MKNHPTNTYLITGATSGIGLTLVEQLLDQGMNVIGIGRSRERCRQLKERLRKEYPGQHLDYCLADLSKQAEIRAAVGEITEILEHWGIPTLDGLVNNAGTFTYWQTITPEGFDTQWAVNHLAPFLLTELLLPLLQKSPAGRVITVSSGSHYGAKLDWSDVQMLERYNPLKAYKRSKLANVLFTAELNRRMGPQELQAAAADPGLVNTGIGEKAGSQLANRIWSWRRRRGLPPEKAAAGILKLLLEVDLSEHPAAYWKHGKPRMPNPFGLDPDHGRRLWQISARMTGVS